MSATDKDALRRAFPQIADAVKAATTPKKEFAAPEGDQVIVAMIPVDFPIPNASVVAVNPDGSVTAFHDLPQNVQEEAKQAIENQLGALRDFAF